MGCLTSTEPVVDYDIIDSLTDEERWEYLAFGFAKRHEINCNCTVPIDIKVLFSKYISHDRIWSSKELDWQEFGEDHKHEMIVLGAAGVGKSAVTIRLAADQFLGEYDPTIEDWYDATINIHNTQQKLSIYDSNGFYYNFSCDRDYGEVLIRKMQRWDGPKIIMIVYAINDKRSLQWIENSQNYLLQCYLKNYPHATVLVGNKIDLKGMNDDYTEVTYEEAVEAANMLRDKVLKQYETEAGHKYRRGWKIPVIEVSAKTGHNVIEAFQLALELFKIKREDYIV